MMQLRIFIFCFIMSSSQYFSAQVSKVDTILYNGMSNKFINIVILGDGYTVTEQTKFLNDATQMSNYLFNQEPWKNYRPYFNVFAIEVISQESGLRHPNTASDCSSANVPVSNPNTHLGVTFDFANIHRLVVPTKNGNIANVLASNFPNYDQVVILGNSPHYGGSGGAFATATNGPSSFEVAVHELGHSFAFLADEYYAGDGFANERANMTKETDPQKVKWKNWMGFKNVGIHQHCCGGQSSNWHRPHNNCKMRFLGREFCPVCSESTVKRIQNLVGSTILNYSPLELELSICNQMSFNVNLIKPVPNTLNVVWEMNGEIIEKNIDSILIHKADLSENDNFLKVIVKDTTSFLRDENHNTTYIQEWKIIKESKNIIEVNGPNIFCQGDSVILSVAPTKKYLWSTGEETQAITVFNPGSYSVKTIDLQGCESTSDTIYVVINPLPEVSFNLIKDTFCLSELPILLSGGLPIGGVYSGQSIENGQLISDLINPGIQQIYYTYIDSNTCMNTAENFIYIDICSNTDYVEIVSDIKIIPNPTSGKFRIQTNNITSEMDLEVYDIKGRIIIENQSVENEIDLTMIANGTYFIKIRVGKRVIFKKLIISR